MRCCGWMVLGLLSLTTSWPWAAAAPPQFERDMAPLFKRHCVKCHGPAKREAKLNLSSPSGLIHGGETGAVLVPHDVDASLLWKRVVSDEMPPESPLSADEKSLLKRWIIAGAPGLAREAKHTDAAEHWAFRKVSREERRETRDRKDEEEKVSGISLALDSRLSALDSFLATDLARDGLTFTPEADRATQIRRVSFDLTGLPPTPEAIAEFIADARPDAYERMVDRYLASPHFGERLGKLWLDAAGYADSNGYFNADTDRPLAYRYRDYVIRAINSDKPFDQFVREQLAGDELARVTTASGGRVHNGGTVAFPALAPADANSEHGTQSAQREQTDDQSLSSHSVLRAPSSALIDLLEATHYLRNGQDGTGESDGNPDEVRVDRYTVIETAMQNLSTGLLGLTIQCAKCHDHKFEPLTQRDYYRLQAVLIPAFPPEQWVKPNDRFVYASLPGELETWQTKLSQADATIARLQSEIGEWVKQHRPRGAVLFADGFDSSPESLGDRWSNTAPGDDAPGGTTAVNLNSREAPGAIVVDGRLQLIEGGLGGDKWLSTKAVFDWTPDEIGASIQVTFDLVENRIAGTNAAERIGYFLALHDFNDNSQTRGGNILIDGHPSSSSAVHSDYPGGDSKQVGVIGTTGYQPGRNYGVRITNRGNGKFVMEHLVDWQVEEKSITFSEADLPTGGFGFEFCCGRSFIVDNVTVESFAPTDGKNLLAEFLAELKVRRQPLDEAIKLKSTLSNARPGKIAWTTDLVDQPPVTHIFLRGNYHTPGEAVEPGGFEVLRSREPEEEREERVRPAGSRLSSLDSRLSRRLAFANWITQPDSAASSLLARVQVNRLWQHHFGTGIVSTPDNFGLSGSPPSHPELLDWLAGEFVHSDWSTKHVTRQIVNSAAYRQGSAENGIRSAEQMQRRGSSSDSALPAPHSALSLDPDARRLSRFPVRRLDAEAIRDAMLFASGDLDDRLFGPYIPTSRTGAGETVVPEDKPGARRRSIYLQQKRTQVHSLLQVFDAPSIVFNSTGRPRSTMPLQSLSLLNSDFAVARSRSLAKRLERETAGDSERLQRLFVLTTGQVPADEELAAAIKFLDAQTSEYANKSDARSRAWTDLCQTLLIGNAALYLE